MRMTFQPIALAWIAALATIPVVAIAEDKPAATVLSEITLDVDKDGKTDRALLVEAADSSMDLYIYLAGGDKKLGISGVPTFVKKAITEGSISSLETNARGSLVLTSCAGCGANKSWAETLTIVYRNHDFLVGGYKRDWDWNSHLADNTVDTKTGSCDINFLTGNGAASQGLEDNRPVKQKFKRIRLTDWSPANLPKICKF